jgi:tetrahydromethanopterin S-methyltransferase subunit C
MSEHKDIDWYTLAALGIIGGLICIYAAYVLNTVLGVSYFAFLGAVGAILATVWGADAVRRICKFGIGTGVPSIGMLAFGMGLATTLLGLKLGDYLATHGLTMVVAKIPVALLVAPVAALVFSLIQGAIIGFIAQNVLKMKIPTMQVGMTMISGAACMLYIGYSVAVTGGAFDFASVMTKVVDTGFIAPLFIVGALPMLHAFNACMGPDEFQKRTLTLAVEAACMSMVIFGILSFAAPAFTIDAATGKAIIDTKLITMQTMLSSIITIALGLIAWFIAYLAYFGKVKESGVPVLSTGLLPKKEEQ